MGRPLPTQCQFLLLNSPPAWPPQEAIGYSKGAPTPIQEDMVREEVQKAPENWGWGVGLPRTRPTGTRYSEKAFPGTPSTLMMEQSRGWAGFICSSSACSDPGTSLRTWVTWKVETIRGIA